MKRRKEENYQTKKSLSLIADLEADCAMTISEHFQTEFNLWHLSEYVERTSSPISNSEAT